MAVERAPGSMRRRSRAGPAPSRFLAGKEKSPIREAENASSFPRRFLGRDPISHAGCGVGGPDFRPYGDRAVGPAEGPSESPAEVIHFRDDRARAEVTIPAIIGPRLRGAVKAVLFRKCRNTVPPNRLLQKVIEPRICDPAIELVSPRTRPSSVVQVARGGSQHGCRAGHGAGREQHRGSGHHDCCFHCIYLLTPGHRIAA